MGYTAEAYRRMLKRLLPPGPIWLLGPDSFLSKLFHGIGDELARIDERGRDLIDETDPRTASETLGDWERVLGLPDEDVTAIPATDAERRLAITAKMIRTGGQTASYFVTLAYACGYSVFVTEGYSSTVFRVGQSTCIDPLRTPGWAHVWEMTVDSVAAVALPADYFEAIIRRAAPAHTVVVFNYP